MRNEPALPIILGPDFEAELIRNYPSLFPEGSPRAGRFVFIRPGWSGLVSRLCDDLDKLPKPEGFSVFQIKTKIGGLRFYLNGPSSPEVERRILEARSESYRTCEVCGRPGKHLEFQSGYIATACAKHRKSSAFFPQGEEPP
jgi:hypothetical protein